MALVPFGSGKGKAAKYTAKTKRVKGGAAPVNRNINPNGGGIPDPAGPMRAGQNPSTNPRRGANPGQPEGPYGGSTMPGRSRGGRRS